jgi:hypothetical protein
MPSWRASLSFASFLRLNPASAYYTPHGPTEPLSPRSPPGLLPGQCRGEAFPATNYGCLLAELDGTGCQTRWLWECLAPTTPTGHPRHRYRAPSQRGFFIPSPFANPTLVPFRSVRSDGFSRPFRSPLVRSDGFSRPPELTPPASPPQRLRGAYPQPTTAIQRQITRPPRGLGPADRWPPKPVPSVRPAPRRGIRSQGAFAFPLLAQPAATSRH